MKEQDLIDLGFKRTDDKFDYQGKARKQYEDSAKFVFIAMLALGVILIGTLIASLWEV
jgi:hypothetical protein